MASVGVGHKLELFVVFYHFVYQQFGILVMHIIVACSVYVEQIPPEILHKMHRRAFYKIFFVSRCA
jgi:hypothetical protein